MADGSAWTIRLPVTGRIAGCVGLRRNAAQNAFVSGAQFGIRLGADSAVQHDRLSLFALCGQ